MSEAIGEVAAINASLTLVLLDASLAPSWQISEPSESGTPEFTPGHPSEILDEDLAFVDALVARTVARGGIDPHRVYAVGYSSGGSSRTSSRAAGPGSCAPSPRTPAARPTKALRGCPAATPVVWCEIGDLGHWVWSAGADASWQFFRSLQ